MLNLVWGAVIPLKRQIMECIGFGQPIKQISCKLDSVFFFFFANNSYFLTIDIELCTFFLSIEVIWLSIWPHLKIQRTAVRPPADQKQQKYEFQKQELNQIPRAIASLTVQGGQEFHFPHFSSNCDKFFFFTRKAKMRKKMSKVWGKNKKNPPTREGPGCATANSY